MFYTTFRCYKILESDGKSLFVKAFLLFYSGDAHNALAVLSGNDIEEANSFNALYLRMRCFEYLSRWDDFEETLYDLVLACETDLEDNVPTSHHRKILWTTLVHWSRVNRQLWIGSMNTLLNDIRQYDKLFFTLRAIALEDKETYNLLKEQGGALAHILCDETSTDQEIIKAINEARKPMLYLGVPVENEDMCALLSACSRLK